MATRLGWVIEGLRTGIVTTPYPKRYDLQATEGIRTRPLLRPERCAAASGCEACVRVCLPCALALESWSGVAAATVETAVPGGATPVLWLDLGRCIGCGLCAATCPEDALVMSTDAELATHEQQALQQAAPLGMPGDTSRGKE